MVAGCLRRQWSRPKHGHGVEILPYTLNKHMHLAHHYLLQFSLLLVKAYLLAVIGADGQAFVLQSALPGL